MMSKLFLFRNLALAGVYSLVGIHSVSVYCDHVA